MSAALIATIVALLLSHYLPEPGRWRRFEWFSAWRRLCSARLGGPAQDHFAGLLLLLSPVLLLAVLQGLLEGRYYGLPSFVLGVAVLFASWGPRDLDRDVEAVLDADDSDDRLRRAEPLFDGGTVRVEGPALVEAVFGQALRRWFAVLFWFMLLGASGALLYRLMRKLVDRQPPLEGSTLAALRLVLEWPPAQLMTLALALAASFDTVLAAWRDWHRARGGYLAGDIGFLTAAARASVVFEQSEAPAEGEVGEAPVDSPDPAMAALRDAMSLVWRILVVWLTVLALFVLAGYVN